MNGAEKITLAAAAALLVGAGCAPVKSQPFFQSHGAANVAGDQQVVERFEEARDREEQVEADEVTVLIDTLPEGLTFEDGVLRVAEDYDHEVVGKFVLGPKAGMFYLAAGFHDYEDGWRKGLCYWQAPLEWVTLGFWSVVPTSYPCHPTPVRSKVDVEQEARLMAKSAGADTVLMGYLGGDQQETLGAAGLLIRVDPRMRGDGLRTRPFKYEREELETAARPSAPRL